jgi:ATP-dependent DNA ligase
MCKVHDGEPELARLSRLRKSQIKGLLVPAARAPASSTVRSHAPRACKLGLEGIVSKRKDSAYRSGRSPDWLKKKNPDAPAVTREAEEDWGR